MGNQLVKNDGLLMKNSIYQLALRCKSISDEKMGSDKTLIPYRNLVFTDYTVKGPADEYLNAIENLCVALFDKYPAVGDELRLADCAENAEIKTSAGIAAG